MTTQKPILMEDSIMQKGLPATAGSKILQGFRAPIDAAVTERLREAGYTLRSAPPATEFGCIPHSLVPSTAVKAVEEGQSDAALFLDFSGMTGDQAALEGAFTIRPTYGTVSRYGLIPSVCSMDTVGIVCKDLRQGFDLLSVIAGHDSRDGVSEPEASYVYEPLEKEIKGLTLNRDKLPLLSVAGEVFHILACAELSGNLGRYDGVKFGYRASGFKGLDDLYLKTRTEGFALDTKLSLIMGAMVLSEGMYEKRYHKAMQIRRMLRDQIDELFAEYDVLSAPALIAPLCGLPSVTKPDGTRLVAMRKNENALYAAAERGITL